MLQDEAFDALVVGARCAGAATALLLARAGLRVLAIDRGGYGTDTLSTHALMRGGVMQLQRWGVLPQIRAAGTPEIRTTSFHYGEETVALAVKPSHGCEALFAPRRTILDRALADAARESGAEIRYRHTVLTLVRDASGRVTGATMLEPSGATRTVRAGLVIGADGAGSAVARLVAAPVLHQARHTSAILYGYWHGLGAAGYRWYYRHGASAGVIPTNFGASCVFAAMPSLNFREVVRHDPEAGYRQVLHQAAPGLAAEIGDAVRRPALRIFAGRRGFLRQAAGPGWALVGDAGYFKDPLTAHGITDALRDAELLARAASSGSAGAMAQYGATRDALSLPLFRTTDEIASFGWTLDGLRAAHQALNEQMKHEAAFLAAWDAPERRAA